MYKVPRALALAVVVSGCVMDVEDPTVSETADPLVAANKLAANKLAANKLAANKLAANSLSASALGTATLMGTADGREVLSFIVGCALPTGQTVTVTYGGVGYSFPGWIGLAPAWATRTPTVTERRWVTACLLARTNLYGIQVDISMRHKSNPVLVSTTTEKSTFTVTEGAFYGDLFAATPTEFACATKSWVAAGAGSFRACAQSQNGTTTECGFTYTADCAKGPACGEKAAPFGSCSGGGTNYAEVITIYLKP